MSSDNQREPSTDKVSADRESKIPEPWEEFADLLSNSLSPDMGHQLFKEDTSSVSPEAEGLWNLVAKELGWEDNGTDRGVT